VRSPVNREELAERARWEKPLDDSQEREHPDRARVFSLSPWCADRPSL